MKLSGMILILFLTSALFAETINVSGTVKNDAGEAVPDAKVTLASDKTMSETTDANGKFILTNVVGTKEKTSVSPAINNHFNIAGNSLRLFLANDAQNVDVSIYSSNGKKCANVTPGSLTAGVHNCALPELVPGYYVMNVTVNQKKTTTKLIATGNGLYINGQSGLGTNRQHTAMVAAEAVVDTLIVEKEEYETTKIAIVSYEASDLEITLKTPGAANEDNLFASVLGKTEEETAEKLESAFQHFFYGDDNQKLYYESGNGACIHDINSGDVRSEGQSYGMMIAVQMDKKEEFDKIWSWTKSVMGQGNGKFGWQASYSGQLNSSGSAPDGEEYIAAALVFAGIRWDDDSYIQAAKQICGAMKSSFFDQGSKIIKFIENVNYNDPSYVLPSFYEVFAKIDNGNASFWNGAAENGRNFWHKNCHSTTMLGSYIANYDGSTGPSDAGGDRGDVYRNDCWRICMNIMMDWHFFGKDTWQKDTFAPKHYTFMKEVYSSPPYPTDMELDGRDITSYNDPITGNVATLAMLGFALPKEDAVFFLEMLWDLDFASGQYRYYDGLLQMMCLLHCAGQYKLYY